MIHWFSAGVMTFRRLQWSQRENFNAKGIFMQHTEYHKLSKDSYVVNNIN